MRLLALVPALALLAAPAFADAPKRAMQACLQAHFDALDLGLDKALGVSVAVLPMQGGEAWQGARGVADRDRGEALTTGHAFRIASNTKTYTAAAVLRLAEQGKLGLDDPIAAHLPAAFVVALEEGGYDPRAIRIRHLLTHTAGLREHVSEDFLLRQAGPEAREWTVPEQLDLAMAAGAPLSPPGTEFHYSDTGYVLLGSIIERHAGQPLPAALRELQAWDANGLAHTWFEMLDPARAPQAHQYWQGRDTRGWHPSFDLYGGGGIVATPADMAAFLRLLLEGRLFEQSASLQTMRTPGVADAWNDYGAGLFELEVDGERLTGHSGFWNTFAFHSPADGVVFAGAVVEKTALPYAALVGSLRGAYRDCAAGRKEAAPAAPESP
ncbi:MAG: beta-lactamase family protein [Rhizobium sp.]|nr:beta-lactamase family protein [Rhizobium sp.]